jgi:transposase-like protein
MGKKEVLGLWIDQTEGAKFWLNVLTQLKNRGVEKIYVACVDGLKGFPEAIKGVFPETEVQLCLVHMVRHSLVYVGSKDKKNVSLDLKKIYTATTEAAGLIGLEEFSKKYDAKYPIISKSWKNNWSGISTFFKYPPEIRRIIYTTNAIEAINSSLRKSINNKGSFPTDEAALKMLYLKIIRLTKKWNMPVLNWGLAMNQFMIRFSEDNE